MIAGCTCAHYFFTQTVADAYVCCRLAGPPITNETAVTVLLEHGITVALGVTEAWEPVNTRFDAGWVSSHYVISREKCKLICL